MTIVSRLLPLGVAGLAFLAFLPALHGTFLNWDDHVNFLGNHAYRGLGWPQIKWMFTTTLLAVYTPLAWLTLGVNYALGGMDPWGYHLGNLLLHAGNAALFFLVARRLLSIAVVGSHSAGDLDVHGGAVVAALVFGLHPLRVESVAWVTERRDVLCGFFYLLAVLAYVRAVSNAPARRARWHAAALLAFAAALLSKGIAMTLPLSLLVLDMYPLGRRPLGWRALLGEKVPYACLAAAGAVVAYVAAGRGSTWTGYGEYGFGARLAMAGYSAWFYPWKFMWPHALSPMYELPPAVDPLAWRFMIPTLCALAVTGILLWLRPWVPGGLAAWMHSLIVIAPVSGVLHAGHQLAHDRWSYLSGLGFALLAGGAVRWTITARRGRRLGGPVVGLALVGTALALLGLGASSWRQSRIWQHSESLWRAAVDVDASCAVCLSNLGVAVVRSGPLGEERIAEAEGYFRAAIRLRSDRMDSYSNLGALLALQRRYPEAEAVFGEVRRRWPAAIEGSLRLAMLYTDQGRPGDAVPLLREVTRLAPGASMARAELARALGGLGEKWLEERRFADAAAIFVESITLRPNNLEPLRGLGRALVEQGRAREAVAPLRHARTLNPRDARVRFWLTRAYIETGEHALAGLEIAALRELDAELAARVLVSHPGR